MPTDAIDLLRKYVDAMSQSAVGRSKIPRPTVTISRESGAGALTVANRVARQLDLDCPGDPPVPGRCSIAIW